MARNCLQVPCRLSCRLQTSGPIVAPGVHLEAINVYCMFYTPQVLLMHIQTHFSDPALSLLPWSAAPKKKSKLATKNRIAQSTPITLKWLVHCINCTCSQSHTGLFLNCSYLPSCLPGPLDALAVEDTCTRVNGITVGHSSYLLDIIIIALYIIGYE